MIHKMPCTRTEHAAGSQMRKMRQSWRVRHLRAHSALFAAREFLKKVKKKEKEKERERKKDTGTHTRNHRKSHYTPLICDFFSRETKK